MKFRFIHSNSNLRSPFRSTIRGIFGLLFILPLTSCQGCDKSDAVLSCTATLISDNDQSVFLVDYVSRSEKEADEMCQEIAESQIGCQVRCKCDIIE